MRPQSVGCVPTYSAGRQPIAVRPVAVTVISRFLILTGCSSIKPSFLRRWWPGLRCVLGSRLPMAFAAGAATLRVFGFLVGLRWRHYVARLMPILCHGVRLPVFLIIA